MENTPVLYQAAHTPTMGRTAAVAVQMKRGILLYLLLLLFEGALRKWFLPALATPLLIVRDPLAIWLLYQAWRHHFFPVNGYTITVMVIAVASIYTAVFIGHGNLFVALFGARILLIHFPFMFLMGQVLSKDDVLRFGRILLAISVPMTILIGLQFYSPQSAWVNRGVGGDMGGSGFSGIGEYFRPAATFSFTNGTAAFYSLAAVFVFYFWFVAHRCNRILLVAATVSLLIAIPLSISRGLFFAVLTSGSFLLLANMQKPQFLGKTVLVICASFAAFLLLSQTGFFQTASEAFLMRFEVANEQEGGLNSILIDRVLGGLIGALMQSAMMPYWGLGIGLGTNVGSMALYGSKMFLVSEGEWGRIVGELGPVMGLTFIALRVSLCIKLTAASYRQLRGGDILSWMLLSFGFLNITQCNLAQTTSLGFFVVGGGFWIAATKKEQPTTLAAE